MQWRSFSFADNNIHCALYPLGLCFFFHPMQDALNSICWWCSLCWIQLYATQSNVL